MIVEDTPPPFSDKPMEVPTRPSGPLPFDWQVVPSILQQLNEPNPEWWARLTDIMMPTLVIGGGSPYSPKQIAGGFRAYSELRIGHDRGCRTLCA
ncbi:hypothetical protein [Bacillus sp. SD075]|uniref:hypothetical protein n=1 Tax=Bacillus sp. SD075 TaxID=2781732 RepID=UPI002570DA06|nr:hypothetical protein [Bacillus sp. SD075]